MRNVTGYRWEQRLWSRRHTLGLLAASPWLGLHDASHRYQRLRRPAAATPPPFTNHARLLVAGPEDGPLAALARAFKSGLDEHLAPDQSVQIDHVGGADGVTAANQFEARVAPDGETALLVPGAAALAWLTGDPRAQFDIGHWLPITTSQVSGLVVVRDPSGLKPGHVRLGIEGSVAMALPAQLGLYLLGSLVDRLVSGSDALQTLANGDADVAFLRGSDVAARAQAALARNIVPLFALGSLDNGNQLQRDPFLPNVPVLPELIEQRAIRGDAALIGAWRSVAAAARLDVALLLPWLTPANVVAWWRASCSEIAASGFAATSAKPELGAAGNTVWHTDPTGNFGLNAIIADTTTSLALHRWLANQPS
jgi:hypothetical protein